MPASLGSYTVLKRHGQGGMGEVFLARDERLDRLVAIKRIRPEREADGVSGRRFRREARLAARLNHPAIVQIHDVLELDDSDCIVMEYVDGPTLRQLLEASTLEPDRVLALGAEIAGGLAEAHRNGIVHRDLKTENVLITPAGQAKIVDFGIAKEAREGAEEALTRGGVVPGTCRAMAPEQARGQEVDHRSDLFSLGTLLYETASGRSPFLGANQLQTLQQVLDHHPPPLTELRPEFPIAFSDLVAQLLQKDPLLRPRSAGEVRDRLLELVESSSGVAAATWTDALPVSEGRPYAAAPASAGDRTTLSTYTPSVLSRRLVPAILVAIPALLVIWYLLPRPGREPTYVMVPGPQVAGLTDEPELQLLAAGIRDALIRQLIALEGVSVKSPRQVDAAAGTPVEVARAVAADEIVGARLDCRAEACQLSLDRTAAADGTVLWSRSFAVPTDDFFLAAKVAAGHLRQAYDRHRVRHGSQELEVAAADLKTFLQLRQEFHDLRQQAPFEEILDALEAMHRSSPAFIDAYLLEARVAILRFYYSRDEADRERAWRAIEEARRRVPDDPQALTTGFHVALQSGRLERAQEALDELERLIPGDVGLLMLRARLLAAHGDGDGAIAVLRAAAERRASAETLYQLAFLEHQNGAITAARGHLDRLLERAPGSYDGRSLLAQLEMFHGDLETAVELYRDLLRESPRLTELSNLGVAYLLLRRYPEAVEQFERAVGREPENPFFLLNLADGQLLLGREVEAGRLYRRVVELVDGDEAAADAQFLTVKGQALAHLGEHRRAVEAVQNARMQAPSSGPIALEAALVYTVIGDQASAMVSAEHALARGIAARWLTLPWFDELRARGELVPDPAEL